MVEKKPTFQSLTEGAESARPSDIREPFGQLPVPSMEERARLFLRAIHGERDFTSSENAEARSTILNGGSVQHSRTGKSFNELLPRRNTRRGSLRAHRQWPGLRSRSARPQRPR
jgi:hypothetical protein